MKKNNKKERFLEVALTLIHEKGFKATTMRDIAQKLNFEVANVYNYIDSKQSLLETYLFNIQNEFHDSINLILDSTHTPKVKLQLVVSSYIQITAKRPFIQALLANEWRNLKEPRLQEFIDKIGKVSFDGNNYLIETEETVTSKNYDYILVLNTILATIEWENF